MIFYGADNPWVWPAASRPGHMVEPKLSDNDEKLVKVPFTIHGLRHTFATCANAAGIGIYDLKLLMNHALSGDVTTVYISSGEHLRRAQQKVTDYISSWMLPQPKSKARTMAAALRSSGWGHLEFGGYLAGRGGRYGVICAPRRMTRANQRSFQPLAG